jgi:hypothetical protein
MHNRLGCRPDNKCHDDNFIGIQSASPVVVWQYVTTNLTIGTQNVGSIMAIHEGSILFEAVSKTHLTLAGDIEDFKSTSAGLDRKDAFFQWS